MAAQTALVTVEKFLRMPEDESRRLELIDEGIVEKAVAHAEHETVKGNINELLSAYVLVHRRWRVCPETQFLLEGRSSLIPDVAVVLRSQVRAADRNAPLQFAPVIAIEVVSSDIARRLEDKVRIYLRNGSASVWIVYPEQREVFVRNAKGEVRIFSEGQILEGAALPELRIAVNDIFQDLAG